jgi:predicted amidophosphoribosyltransferase
VADLDVRNCKNCGRVFRSSGNELCAQCDQELQKEYGKIRDYLYEHQNSTPIEINQATGVSIKIISKFLKDDRFDVRKD